MPDIELDPETKEDTAIAAAPSKMWINIAAFRYILTLMLVTVKLGVLAYIQPNPLADVHWFWVFLPAFIIELSIAVIFFSVIALVVALALLVGIVHGIVTLCQMFYFKFVYRRGENKCHEKLMEQVLTDDIPEETTAG